MGLLKLRVNISATSETSLVVCRHIRNLPYAPRFDGPRKKKIRDVGNKMPRVRKQKRNTHFETGFAHINIDSVGFRAALVAVWRKKTLFEIATFSTFAAGIKESASTRALFGLHQDEGYVVILTYLP